ncbi:MAG: signal peptidase II [Candidatus Nanopelagicaceae bacterium]
MQTEGRAPLKSSSADRARRLFISVALSVFAVDLASKNWAESYLQYRPPLEIFGDFLKLSYSTNSGAAFSLFTDATLLLSSLKLVVVGFIIFYMRNLTHPLWGSALGALLGGVVGNLYDRAIRPPGVWRGEVIDWIVLPNWPTFNIADSAIFCAGISMTILTMRNINPKDPKDRIDGAA